MLRTVFRSAGFVVAISLLLAGSGSPCASAADAAPPVESPEREPGDPGEFPAAAAASDLQVEGESLPVDELEQEAQIQAMVDAGRRREARRHPAAAIHPGPDIAPPKGLILLKTDPRRGEFPFGMAIGGYMQLRWFEFARDATQWTNNASHAAHQQHQHVQHQPLPALLPRARRRRAAVYNFALFGTTNVGIRSGVVPIGLAGLEVRRCRHRWAGVTPVPGTREWIEGVAVDDRHRSQHGQHVLPPRLQPGHGRHRLPLPTDAALPGGRLERDRRRHDRRASPRHVDGLGRQHLVGAVGPFGLGVSDMEHHDEPVIRVGTSGVYALTYALPIVGSNPEDTHRAALGRHADRGAQRPRKGYSLLSGFFTTRLGRCRLEASRRGPGLRVLLASARQLLGQGTFERTSIFDQGGMAYLSWCFVPRTYEAYGRSSAVTGPYGTGQEYGGGQARLNWYLKGRLPARPAAHVRGAPHQSQPRPRTARSSSIPYQEAGRARATRAR
jgi:hypothetical protein